MEMLFWIAVRKKRSEARPRQKFVTGAESDA